MNKSKSSKQVVFLLEQLLESVIQANCYSSWIAFELCVINMLQTELESKVAKFQQFIIKATATPGPAAGGPELARACTLRQ